MMTLARLPRWLTLLLVLMLLLPLSLGYLFINEVNLHIEGSTGVGQFVELHCYYHPCRIGPHTYKLAFADSETLYKVIDIPGRTSPVPNGGRILVGPAELDPDVDWGDFVIHLDSPSAVILYYDPTSQVITGLAAPSINVQSYIAFSMHNPITTFPTTFRNIYGTTFKTYPVPEVDRSISNCNWERLLVSPTPKAQNACPNVVASIPQVIINELNAQSPQGDKNEFVELLNIASVPVHLGEYTLVLYDGRDNTAYKVIPLSNATLPVGGFYVIGSPRLSPPADQILEEGSLRVIQNRADAVALYRGPRSQYNVDMGVTDEGLVDAMVYDVRGRHSEILTATLTPGFQTLHEDWRALDWDETLSRCNGTDARNSSQFGLHTRSNGRANICTRGAGRRRPPPPSTGSNLSPVIINEFSLENTNQYVELYDGGIGNYPLDGILVVLYRSFNMRVFRDPLNLYGHRTDSDGYLLIKVGDSASESEPNLDMLATVDINAITLYLDPSNSISRGAYVTTKDLFDVVLYGIPSVSRGYDLADALLPGAEPLSLDNDILLASNSYSRCRGWSAFQLSSFVVTSQSPGTRNLCPTPNVVINELDLVRDPKQGFIELFSDGQSGFSLDGLFLAIYARYETAPGYVFRLDGHVTDDGGFATVGHENGTNVDIAIDSLYFGWTEGIGAVALYLGTTAALGFSDTVPTEGLVDALVVSSDSAPDLDLMHALTPHQKQLNDLSVNTSISRCFCCLTRNAEQFGVAPPTPGDINRDCRIGSEIVTESLGIHQSLLRINEVSATHGGNGLFVEIYDGGYGGVKMDDLMLSLYSSGHQFYSHYPLQKEGPLGKTNDDGFYNVGTPSSGTTLNVQIHESERLVRQTTNAVILWKNTDGILNPPNDFEINKDYIVDAVIFSDWDTFDYGVVKLFSRGWMGYASIAVNDTFMNGGCSISRCHSHWPQYQLAYSPTVFTPGMVNKCPMPAIVINEFNFMLHGEDLVRFIELSSLGVQYYPLENIVLVLYSRSGTVHRRYGINSDSTHRFGFYILGYKRTFFPPLNKVIFTANENLIPVEAVALYRGKERDFPLGRLVTNASLIDAIVYGSGPVNQTLIDVLTLGKDQVTTITDQDRSINRCVEEGGRVVHRSAHISPMKPNFCPYDDVKLVINEVSLQQENQFIEVWDFGMGLSALGNVSLVLFDNDGHAYMDIPLNNQRTESGGFFVIGTRSVIPRSQYGSDFAAGFIRTTSGAVALYKRAEGYPTEGDTVSTEGLLDAVVYSDESERLSPNLEALSPNITALPSLLLQEEDSSMSRCFSERRLSTDSFSTRPVTPLGLNDCPVFETDILINELRIHYSEEDWRGDFIELYDGGRGDTPLDDYTLVLFDAQNQDRSYVSVNMAGWRTSSEGFVPIWARYPGQDEPMTPGYLHEGPIGVAIYRAPELAFSFGSLPEPRSIVDAIVYSMNEETADSMVTALTPGYPVFYHPPTSPVTSISRCYGNQRQNPTNFGLAPPSPGKLNNCSSATAVYQPIVINEVNIEPVASNSQYEYIELYDLGVGDTSLEGYSLVFYDGGNQARSYYEVDLNGERTDSNGYFTVGRESTSYSPQKIVDMNFLQNGPDAIVLYRRPSREFPRATVATIEGAIDVLVYGTDDDEPTSLIDKLTPGQIQINEQQLHYDGKVSLSRCLNNNTMSLMAFMTSYMSPGLPNNCTMIPIYINEINLVISNQDRADFIELYDGGRGYTPLDSVVLVLYSEAAGSAFRTLPLQNNQTDRNGFFTIGGAGIFTDVTIDSGAFWGMLSKYPGAVALYRGSNRVYQPGMNPTVTNLMDVVIMGGRTSPATVLGSALAPDQPQIIEQKFLMEGDESISRCTCCNPVRMSEFALGPATPQVENKCTSLGEVLLTRDRTEEQFVVINEVSMVVDRSSGTLPMEVELYGSPGMSLDNYVLVYYSVGPYSANSYLIVSLSGGTTNDDGYYTLTQGKTAALEQLGGGSGSKTGVKAVALYDRYRGEYSFGMRVTDTGLVDAVTFTDGNDRASALSDVLSVPLTGMVNVSDKAKTFLVSYQPLSLSRCACCSIRNNSVFAPTTWTPDQPNSCPDDTGYLFTIHMRLHNADYSRWSSNSAWRFYLKEIIVKGVEDLCQCGFTLAYFKDEWLLEGSVVFAAELLSLDRQQGERILQSYKSFIRQTSTITIMDQVFTVDSCTQNCVHDPNARQTGGKAGGIILSLIGVIIVLALVAGIVLLVRRYRSNIHMIYIRTFRMRGDPDGVTFNNNQNSGLDDGVVNPVYEGGTLDDGSMSAPTFEDPTVNTTGETRYIATC